MSSEVMTQAEAWEVYDQWLEDPQVAFLDEPAGLEHVFRSYSQRRDSSPKDWTDSYLVAFSAASGLRLVTFDKALRSRTSNLELLNG